MKKLIEKIGFMLGLVKPIKKESSEPFLINFGMSKATIDTYTLPSGQTVVIQSNYN